MGQRLCKPHDLRRQPRPGRSRPAQVLWCRGSVHAGPGELCGADACGPALVPEGCRHYSQCGFPLRDGRIWRQMMTGSRYLLMLAALCADGYGIAAAPPHLSQQLPGDSVYRLDTTLTDQDGGNFKLENLS